MKIYAVGGAVRDELLGLPVQDRDYVVVGATPEELIAAGFRPVGRDFPVFLHPKTHEEYALARTERKTAPGYHGFVFHYAPDVTLEDDLLRRDLSINAMAREVLPDGRLGPLIDPCGGERDLRQGVLRHVSAAFAEDPVRILRLARFAARFWEFGVAADTLQLMRRMVDAGEVDALVPERVWQELARGLMEARPARMLRVLRECGALQRILPEVDALFGVPQPPLHHPEIDTGLHVLLAVDMAAALEASLPARFAALTHDLGKARTPPERWPSHSGHEAAGVECIRTLCGRLRVPNDCRDLAILTAREHGNVHRAASLRPGTVIRLLERCDAFRKPARFRELLTACEADYRGRSGLADRPYPQRDLLLAALDAARSVDTAAIAQAAPEQADIPERIRIARQNAIAALRPRPHS